MMFATPKKAVGISAKRTTTRKPQRKMDGAVREKMCREKACRVEMPDCQVMAVDTEVDDFGRSMVTLNWVYYEVGDVDYYIRSAEMQTGIKRWRDLRTRYGHLTGKMKQITASYSDLFCILNTWRYVDVLAALSSGGIQGRSGGA